MSLEFDRPADFFLGGYEREGPLLIQFTISPGGDVFRGWVPALWVYSYMA